MYNDKLEIISNMMTTSEAFGYLDCFPNLVYHYTGNIQSNESFIKIFKHILSHNYFICLKSLSLFLQKIIIDIWIMKSFWKQKF